jgi:inorganic phosphate transporter, PiT family
VLLTSSHLGFPLSTTQVCSGSILGAGLGKRLAEVRWTVAGRIALAWLFTLPAAAIVGALAGDVANSGNFGVAIVAVLAAAAGLAMYVAARRRPVTADNVNEYPGTATAADSVKAA